MRVEEIGSFTVRQMAERLFEFYHEVRDVGIALVHPFGFEYDIEKIHQTYNGKTDSRGLVYRTNGERIILDPNLSLKIFVKDESEIETAKALAERYFR